MGPQVAGRYFKKLECFCFSQADAAAGRGAQDAGRVRASTRSCRTTCTRSTLSYTFFEVEDMSNVRNACRDGRRSEPGERRHAESRSDVLAFSNPQARDREQDSSRSRAVRAGTRSAIVKLVTLVRYITATGDQGRA